MSQLQTKLLTDTWATVTWDEYIEIIKQPDYEEAKCYYYNGQLRIEMAAVGPDHADDNGMIIILTNLFGIAKNIKMRLLVNCSYRKTGVREAQPDVSYYIGERVQFTPRGSSVVNLDSAVAPDLAIEIADSSLLDDLGTKRMLYEELGVSEYWVVDVQKAQIIAFKIIANRGSARLTESEVLPGLKFALLEESLRRSRETDHTEVGSWFFDEVRQEKYE